MRKIQKILLTCPECDTKFERYPYQVKPNGNYYCSRACAYKNMPACSDERKHRLSVRLTGAGNPAFGGGQWDEKRRKKHSNYMKRAMKDEARRYASGNANRGKEFSDEICANMSAAHIGIKLPSPSPSRRKQIGEQSSLRWKNPEYRQNIIKKGLATKESKGSIIPRSKLSDWHLYWKEVGWISGFKYTEEINLREKGLCRDHIVGRKQGFLLGIFPEILQHPENCQVISLSENTKKARRISDPNQPQLLMNRILTYSGNYPEHHRTVALVEKYLSGERWIRR